ncbi:uncharacterized protein LOC127442138 [Myxocyprinus asiaticus]|uniref:uncharacterized protein LOC127442138 n=1 Tax=Myxocyprinus asiaticus TaxID=70543 RepID=UPI00222386C2|nr:uncharacterized protein LOC127442138 [Myxocyprinus asiaticus]
MYEYCMENPRDENSWMALSVPTIYNSMASACNWPLQSKRTTTDLIPPSGGASSFEESDKDIYITQLIHRLESLSMSTVVNTQQVPLLASISSAYLGQEPTTCCSQTKSSQVLMQHQKTQLRMLSHRWQRLGLQPPIPWGLEEHISEHHKPVVETTQELEIRPIEVTRFVSLRDIRSDEINIIRDSHSVSSDSLDDGPLEPSVPEQCIKVSVQSEDSDLSDQEKDSFSISKWAPPVELDLRPDSFDRDLDSSEAAEAEQIYPEVFPVPLKDLDFNQSHFSELESQENMNLSDPCLTAMVARVIKLERLEAATIQKEQAKVFRSRPATGLVRIANRLKPVEIPCSNKEHSSTRSNNSILDDLTKLTLFSRSQSLSRHNTCPLSNGRVCNGVQEPPTLLKKPQSSAVKLRETKGQAYDFDVHLSESKYNSSKRHKPTKKAMQKTSDKTSVPAKVQYRKT